MQKTRLKKLAAFLSGILAIIIFIMTVSYISPSLPGFAGKVYRNNLENDIEATALIYSESGDIADYLDSENGKYWLKLDMKGHIVK